MSNTSDVKFSEVKSMNFVMQQSSPNLRAEKCNKSQLVLFELEAGEKE